MMFFRIGTQAFLYENTVNNRTTIRLKPTINSAGLNFPVSDWSEIYPQMALFQTDHINELYIAMNNQRSVIVSALEHTVVIQFRQIKASKVLCRSVKLDKEDFTGLVACLRTMLNSFSVTLPPAYIPTSVSANGGPTYPADESMGLTDWATHNFGSPSDI